MFNSLSSKGIFLQAYYLCPRSPLLHIYPGGLSVRSKYETPLIDAMLAISAGECPAELLAEQVKSHCDQQLPDMHNVYEQLGALKEVTFEGVQPVPGREGKSAERYKVTFEHGDWLWYIDLASNGKIKTLWAPHRPDFGATIH